MKRGGNICWLEVLFGGRGVREEIEESFLEFVILFFRYN